MNQSRLPSPLESTVVIVGVGLIGGSIAAAVKQRNVAEKVIGVGRDQQRMNAARHAGLLDEGVTDIAHAIAQGSLVIFSTPVDRVASGVRELQSAVAGSSAINVGRELLVTDAGSVKGPICRDLADMPTFIGSHPIAGSHRQGFEAADPELFAGRLCVVTPLSTSTDSRIGRVERFWKALGMRTVQMTPEAHDSALAMTSHLPHVVASALSMTLTPENRILTGSGFRDTTRIAAGDPELWKSILLQNSEAVGEGISHIQQQLNAFQEALSRQDASALLRILREAQSSRMSLEEPFQ